MQQLDRCLATFGSLTRSGHMNRLPFFLTVFMECMAELTIAWLLLDSALTSDGILSEKEDLLQSKIAFHEGKIAAAQFFVRFVLSVSTAKFETINAEICHNDEIELVWLTTAS